VGFLILAFFFLLAPSSSVVPLADVMVEHRVYLASSIIVLGLVIAGYRLAMLPPLGSQLPLRAVALVCMGIMISGLGWRTWTRNKDYQTNLALWTATTQTTPMNARAWNNLGGVYLQMSAPSDAVAPLERALHIAPGYASAWSNLANALAEMGRFDDAYRVTLRAEQTLGRRPAALLVTRGWALVELGRHPEARPVLQEALAEDAGNAYAWTNLANAACGMGDHEAGMQAYNRALDIRPGHVNALIGRGATYLESGDFAQASADMAKASALAPENPLPTTTMATLRWPKATCHSQFANMHWPLNGTRSTFPHVSIARRSCCNWGTPMPQATMFSCYIDMA
jgi:Tfp pilus assembly protein PilF